MSERPCDTCSRIIADGASICAGCGYRIDDCLAEIVAYRGLGYDLDMAMARRTHLRLPSSETAEDTTGPGMLPATPLPYNPRAADAGRELKSTLVGWVRLVIDETGAEAWPDDTLTSVARWLRGWVGWLRHHPAAADAYGEILKATGNARRVVDRPAEKLYAGACDCGEHLYARPGSLTIICESQAHPEPVVWPVEERRVELLAALDDHLANSQQMSRLIGYLGVTLPDATIRWWASKGRIVAHGNDPKGNPMYRLGDVVRTYAQAGRKKAVS